MLKDWKDEEMDEMHSVTAAAHRHGRKSELSATLKQRNNSLWSGNPELISITSPQLINTAMSQSWGEGR